MEIDVLSRMGQFEHEQVVFCNDASVGLKAIIAIHNTTLGPALGGTRMWNYTSEEEALYDVLRLSRGMTYKAAAAGLSLGGGKTVILGNPKKDKKPGFFEAYGRFVESLNGRYITAEDVGTTVSDMESVLSQTKHVVGTQRSHGGSGDPSPFTARGVYLGMKAAAKKVYGSDSLAGKKIALQGAGSVGRNLVNLLVAESAEIMIADIDEERVSAIRKAFPGVQSVSTNEIVFVHCDIFSPCALGAVVNDDSIGKLRCQIIAGAANNQLARQYHADMLRGQNILYIPDYVINAGGLINVSLESSKEGYSEEKCLTMIDNIFDQVSHIIEIAEKRGISTAEAADRLAEEILEEKGRTGAKMFLARSKEL
ncbi:MAG: leucine dehydrogenase [Deltaproteobacteria bacterium CG11_big_fil_rev_8_21_14_0_20_42_23]|nr:MAG: leucine dehydrogenase [Deltaproteobacteria bacterium CG11_big_fil_rev_8_21_14_0_20_42_23]PJC65244.1 MAG: leucine dehydrogenase [Deltaproteobacteria bacterium CG_4_9_14_0_2_um_filter_42_21]